MHLKTRRARLIAAASATALAAALSTGLAATSATAGTRPSDRHDGVRLDRVFIIMLENHSEKSVIGDPNAPYITSLAQHYGQATSYYGVTHPSEPNYVAMISGSNWWTNTDDPANRFDHTNLVDELDAAHISWGAYMEAMPAGAPLTDFWPSISNPLYASKHNPFALFTDIRANPADLADIKPYTSLAGDLNSWNAPRFVYIVPDQCNDMHGGVYTAVPGYPETPCPYTGVTANGGWDSPAGCCDSPVLPAGDPDINAAWPGGLYGGGLVPAIVIDPSGPRHFTDATPFNHYSLLRTIEDAWHLPELGFTSDHAQVATMDSFLGH